MGLRRFIKNIQKTISSPSHTTAESSKYSISNSQVQNSSGYFQFSDFDKNGKINIKIDVARYTTR